MKGTVYSGAPQHRGPTHGQGWGEIPDAMEVDEEDQPQEAVAQRVQQREPKMVNPLVYFREVCENLGERPEAAHYENGTAARFVVLKGELDNSVSDKFQDKIDARLIRATTKGADEKVTNFCITNHVLAIPVHNSPVVALMENSAISTWTDSISSLRQLLFFRWFLYKVALDDAEHCKMCEGTYQRLKRDVDNTFFDGVDQLLAARPNQSMEQTSQMFGILMEQYMVNLIRVIEWNILDMKGVPLRFRGALMTPNNAPTANMLTQEQGNILRKNLCWYLRKRKEVFTGALRELMKHGLLKDAHLQGGNPEAMDESESGESARADMLCQGDRLQVLTLEADFNRPDTPKYKGYICASTLINYLYFLDTPKDEETK